MKIVNSCTKKAFTRIPTRFDDIQQEIIAERMRSSVKEYKKYVPQIDKEEGSFILGDVIGQKLNKII